MGTIQEVMQALAAQHVGEFKEATRDESWSQEQVDEIWVQTCKVCKAALIKHALTLGTPGQDALGESLVVMISEGKDALVLTYIEHLDDVDWQDVSGRTLMSHAVQWDRRKVIAALIGRGADATLTDTHGLPPIYYAMQSGKSRIAVQLLEHGVTLHGETGRAIIDMASSRELSMALGQLYVAQRQSSMTGAQFIHKWGAITQAHEEMVWPEASRTGERIMKGEMYTVGYFPAGQDPTGRQELDWEAIDAAKELAAALVGPLREASCAGFSNSDAPVIFHPFFIPSLGRSPTVDDFDARMSEESLGSGSGTRGRSMEVVDQGPGGFDTERCRAEVEDGMISAAQSDAYDAVRACFEAHCTHVREYRFYTDLAAFPVIIGGLDVYYNFVGVVSEVVWT